MRWIRCIFWAFWSLALIAIIGAWVRARMYSETFLEADSFGEVRGLITTPNGLFLFKNSSQNGDPGSLDLPIGFHYYNVDARAGASYDGHILYTHRGLNGVIAVGVSPGIAVRGCSFNGINCEEVVVSFWFLICALMIVPAESVMRLAIRAGRARRRRRRGLCIICGYDLRVSKERCPECGTSISNTFKVNAQREADLARR